MNLPRRNIIAIRFALFVALIAIMHLATTSIQYPVVDDFNDKVNHIMAFYTLALLLDFSYPKSKFGLAKISVLLGYGLAIEIIQYFLPYRSASLFDLAADSVGLIVYWLSIPALKWVPWVRSRWDIEKQS